MGATSGRVLRDKGEIVSSGLTFKRVNASLQEHGQHVAKIESWMKPTEILGAIKARRTTVTFVDGVEWSIVTEPPVEPPDVRTFAGIPVSGAGGGFRVAIVRDQQKRVLAEAIWPDRKTQRAKMAESMGDREAFQETTEAVMAAGRASTSELRERRSHRKGRAKWLIIGLVALFFAFAWLPLPIVGLATGEYGLAVGFGIAFAVALTLGLWSIRRWRDAATCWSCGQPVTGKPETCPLCQAAKPRSAGFAPRMLGTETTRGFGKTAASGTMQRLMSPILRGTMEAPEVSFGEDTLWLLPVDLPGRFTMGSRLGDILTLETRFRATTMTPERAVPLEAALLCWHIEAGDVTYPSDSGGGG